jgi:hypothetical protein
LSAASVAVIYAYRQKTARAEWKIFSIFFQTPGIAGCRPANRMWKTLGSVAGGKGEGGWGRIWWKRKHFPGVPEFFKGAFSSLWKQFDGCHGFVSKPA